jgi:hypothetical protein
MPTSLLLDEKTEKILGRLARSRRQTKSQVIRVAILRLDDESESESRAPYPLIEALLGRVRGGPTDLSERTGERFRELLTSRRRARR